MIALIAAGPEALDAARGAVALADAHPARLRSLATEAVVWQPPPLRPSKLCSLALTTSASADRILSGPPIGRAVRTIDLAALGVLLSVTIEYVGALTSNLRRLGTQETAT